MQRPYITVPVRLNGLHSPAPLHDHTTPVGRRARTPPSGPRRPVTDMAITFSTCLGLSCECAAGSLAVMAPAARFGDKWECPRRGAAGGRLCAVVCAPRSSGNTGGTYASGRAEITQELNALGQSAAGALSVRNAQCILSFRGDRRRARASCYASGRMSDESPRSCVLDRLGEEETETIPMG
jgi:hypothetical protein